MDLYLRARAIVFTLYFIALPVAYYIILRLPRGWPRLILMAPFIVAYIVIPRFIESPLIRSTQVISWYTSLKLILLCYDRPLDTFQRLSQQKDTPLHMSTFLRFCASMFFPVSFQSFCNKSKLPFITIANTCIHIFCTAIPLAFYFNFCQNIPPHLRLPFTSILTYCGVQIQHCFFTLLLRFALGVNLTPAFNKPWLSESCLEFWGERWNLVVHDLLKETIYNPLLEKLWPEGTKNRTHDLDEAREKSQNENKMKYKNSLKPPLRVRLPAVFITFLMSGFIHEISFVCITHNDWPTWAATITFLIHGFVTCLEIVMRRKGPMPFPRPIKICFTVGFMFVVTSWVFLPAIVNTRYYVDVAKEYQSLVHSTITLMIPLVNFKAS